MIHPHLVVTYRLDEESALFTPRNDRVYSHYVMASFAVSRLSVPERVAAIASG